MDRLINNECIVICTVISALMMGVNEISKLYLFTVLAGDRAIRKRLSGYVTYTELATRESGFYLALNRKFVEFQPVFLNSMTMLEISGKIEKIGSGLYNLTAEGARMALDLQEEKEGTTAEVLKAVIQLNGLLGDKNTKRLYNDFKIVL